MQIKLTKVVVEKTPPHSKDLFLWDSEVPGFGVKITPKGKRVYVAQYRVAGRSRRVTIAKHGILTIEKARDAAKDRLAQATLGGDPAADKMDLRHGPTVKELGTRYLAEHADHKTHDLGVQNPGSRMESDEGVFCLRSERNGYNRLQSCSSRYAGDSDQWPQ